MNVSPDPEEIIQYEPPTAAGPVPVAVQGPVETREVPAAGPPGYFTVTGLGAVVAVRVLPLEPRRKSATIMAQSQDIWISGSQAGAQSGVSGAMRWPALVPKVIDHMHEVWVCAVAGTTDVSVETVKWSQ